MKKLLFFILLSLQLSTFKVHSMKQDTPKTTKKASAYNQLIELFNQNPQPIENPITVERGFGQTFDYASILNPGGEVEPEIYKRRLTAFKHYLFDYIEGRTVSRPQGKKNCEIKSGCVSGFLNCYARSIIAKNKAASFLPRFRDQFFQEHVVRVFMPRTAFNEEGGGIICSSNEGHFGYVPFVRIQGDNSSRVPWLDAKQKTALALKADRKGKQLERFMSQPLFILTEPDAESICFTFGKPEFGKLSLENRAQQVLNFAKIPGLSEQAKRILNCYIHPLAQEKLRTIIAEQKDRKEETVNELDRSLFDICCPHIPKLQFFEKYLLDLPNRQNKELDLALWNKTFTDLKAHTAALDQLSCEYSTLYDRIHAEIKELNAKKKAARIAQSNSELDELEDAEEKLIEEAEPNDDAGHESAAIEPLAPIKYDDRICRWYRTKYTISQKISSIFYHTALPRIADDIVRKHGKKTPFKNKTIKGQIDDHYTICGKITDESGKESFHKFHICIDPNGICYHRGCEECCWEELSREEKFDFKEEKPTCQVKGPEIQLADKIVTDAPTHAIIFNSMHKCTVTLYKML